MGAGNVGNPVAPPSRWRDRVALEWLPELLQAFGPFEMVFPGEPEKARKDLLRALGVRVVVDAGVPGPVVRVRR